MQVIEPTGRVRFRSYWSLHEHVIKHVIENRDERWHQVLDEELVAAARAEWRSELPGPAFHALESNYQAVVAQKLMEACAQGKGHRHLYRYRHRLELPPKWMFCPW